MKEWKVKLVLVGVMVGSMTLSLGGCAMKKAQLESAEETAKVEDTIKAGAAADQAAAMEPASGGIAKTTANEGAGAIEPLETPDAGLVAQSGLSGTPGTAEIVEGSRTSLGLQPVYFDYDKSTIRPDQVERIRANALYLKSNQTTNVRIEGNCDERGTYEYNMALGEWRAMSAKKYLINLGIDGERLTTLSYGEERPVNPGQDEIAWAQNRRDDFVIVQ